MEDVFNSKDFLVELCRYYMEFLESDFKEKRAPARRINFWNKDGLLTDISLNRYPDLNEKALGLLSDFQKNPFNKVDRSDFTIKFSQEVIETVKAYRRTDGTFHIGKVEKCLRDFLQRLSLVDSEGRAREITDYLRKTQELDFLSYLAQYRICGFHDEIYDLWKNKQVLDKQDFYFYFLDITHQGITYPVFYIPVSIDRLSEGIFTFEFDPVFLINKKAIQYVSERFADERKKEWRIDLPPRHMYLSNYETKDALLECLQNIINEIFDFFGVAPFKLGHGKSERAGNEQVTITNNCYLSIFDKSDEALLNDYEELLNLALSETDGRALQVLSKLSTDYLFENPVTCEREVEDEYDGQPISEKLTYNSPIPLNKEQLLVLKSVDKKECNRIIIEGPPGTGKSHTITALINNALLKKKSVLMVSDKKEALDVVEEKINDVLGKMKLDDFIQNPIVRLGKKENTFAGIFKQINYDKIKNRYNAFKKHKDQVDTEITGVLGRMRKDIDEEIEACVALDGNTVHHLVSYDDAFLERWQHLLDMDELERTENSTQLLEQLLIAICGIREACERLSAFSIDLLGRKESLTTLRELADSLEADFTAVQEKKNKCKSLLLLREMNRQNLVFLTDILKKAEDVRKPVIGYLLSRKKLKAIEDEFRERFYRSGISIKQNRSKLLEELQFYQYCEKVLDRGTSLGLDLFAALRPEDGCKEIRSKLKDVITHIDTIVENQPKLRNTCLKLGINKPSSETIIPEPLSGLEPDDVVRLRRYLDAYLLALKTGDKQTNNTFAEDKRTLENRIVLQMTGILDESVVAFREQSKNDAEELKKLIKAKKQIPKEYLKKLVEAFPCVIVGIRELGDYIPLEPDVFDLAIIDEASQVSIAQAFPVIIRAKKIIVLGDPKQYSNVKSHNASIAVNNFLFHRVKGAFERSIATLQDAKREMVKDKVDSFNIKNSILDFIRNITNYQCSLKKHFRSYIELIGFSNQTFYQKSLQVMKIRGKSIGDVIQFYILDSSGEYEKHKNTNQAEADYLLRMLQRLKEEQFRGTVGIITPFTNQQKLISNMVYSSPDWQFYHDEFKLRVMTFDSCQGDEKDLIYYSMVEKPKEDILKYVFPVELSHIDDEEDGNLKAQRLNVGFSRAKEGIRFVMSKQPQDVRGEVGKALQFYAQQLEKPDEITILRETDQTSPMEALLYSLVTQTPFYMQNKDRIDIIPQFDIGRYIKQLDPYAQIPNYRTDFLIIYKDDQKTNMVILEYDGFEYHFKDTGVVDSSNFERFYVEGDLERRKTIESYGYPFIRFNKFLLKDEPINFLNSKLEYAFKKKP
ncbi:MAG: AAA domain-containing protein [Syntrophales bacterium LBB04]|nr:AAA domain-containing protein [Syntrophales bacterium LBB04]